MKKFILLCLLVGLQVGGVSAAESKDDEPGAFSTELLPVRIQEGLQLIGLDIAEIALEQGFNLQSYINGDADDGYARYDNFMRNAENKIVEVLFGNGSVARFKDLLIQSIQENKPFDVSGDAQLSLVRDIIDLGWLQAKPEMLAIVQELNAFRFQDRRLDLNNTLLNRSIEQNSNIAKLLISMGINVRQKHITGYTSLHAAASRDDIELIKLLLQKGADIEAQWVNDRRIDRFISASQRDNKGVTPLHVAMLRNNMPIVELLLDHGADINKIAYVEYSGGTPVGLSPLCLAIKSKNCNLVKHLLNKGVCIEEKGQYDQTPLLYAVVSCIDNNRDYCYEDEPQEDNESEEQYRVRIFKRGKVKSLEIIETLLQAGADIEACDDRGETALILALSTLDSSIDIIKILLMNQYAKPAISDAVMQAAVSTHKYSRYKSEIVTIIQLLVDHGGNLSGRDKKGNSLLCKALSSGDRSEVLQFLQSKGLDVRAVNNDGETLLHIAAKKEDQGENINYLCGQGLDINQPDNAGQTPIVTCLRDRFFMHSNPETFFALLDAGAQINLQELNVQVITRYNSSWNTPEIVQRLLDLGVDPDDISIPRYRPEAVQALVDAARPRYVQRRAQLAEQNGMSAQDRNVVHLQPAMSNQLASASSTAVMPLISATELATVPAVVVPERSMTREELRAAAAQAAIERQEKAMGK